MGSNGSCRAWKKSRILGPWLFSLGTIVFIISAFVIVLSFFYNWQVHYKSGLTLHCLNESELLMCYTSL